MSTLKVVRVMAIAIGAAILSASTAHATVFGEIQGIVHDPQHRPIAGAKVVLESAASALSQTAETDRDGAFRFQAVPFGAYKVTVSHSGFAPLAQSVTLASGTSPYLSF